MIFFFIHFSLSWAFATSDELIQQCSLCKFLVKNKLNLNRTHENIPQVNSFCKSHTQNHFCKSIIGMLNQIDSLKSETAIHNYCYNSFSCDEISPFLIGSKCPFCIHLGNQLLRHKPIYREKAFYSFCTTSRTLPSSLCGEIIEDGLLSFLNEIESGLKIDKICLSHHFCSINKSYPIHPDL